MLSRKPPEKPKLPGNSGEPRKYNLPPGIAGPVEPYVAKPLPKKPESVQEWQARQPVMPLPQQKYTATVSKVDFFRHTIKGMAPLQISRLRRALASPNAVQCAHCGRVKVEGDEWIGKENNPLMAVSHGICLSCKPHHK